MQAKFLHSGLNDYNRILVEHNNETLEFNGVVFQQAFKKGTYEPFEQLNRFWKRLEPVEQDELFALYRQAREVFNEVFDAVRLISVLRPIVDQILEFHTPERIEHWTRVHAGIWIPEDLDVEYHECHTRPGSRDQTYLVSDYWELVFMLMRHRSITPLWGEFAESTKRESGTTFRDLNVYFTISKSDLVKDPAMERLNRYIARNLKQNTINIRSTIDGIGSDRYQMNLIANIMVRSLAVASFTKDPTGLHLVQIIHKALRNRLSQNESHQNQVGDKNRRGGDEGSNDEDSSSRAEKYKNKPRVAPGEFTALERYTENVESIAARLLLKPELDRGERSRLKDALKSASLMEGHSFEECQLSLIRWVTNPIISPRALWDISKFSIIRLAGISQFVLYETGFKELAGIVTAQNITSQGYAQYTSESRAHIPKDMIEEINRLYPFYRRHPTKKTAKPVNDTITEIMNLSQELSKYLWLLNMNGDLIAELRGSSANKTYTVKYDIRIRLAEYVIYLQKRNSEFRTLSHF